MPDQKQDEIVFYEEPQLLDVYRRDAGDGNYTEGVVVGKQVSGTFERDGRTLNRWSATAVYDGQSEWRFNSHTRFVPGASGQWTRTVPTRAVVVSVPVEPTMVEPVVVKPVVVEPVVVEKRPALTMSVGDPEIDPAPRRRRRFGG